MVKSNITYTGRVVWNSSRNIQNGKADLLLENPKRQISTNLETMDRLYNPNMSRLYLIMTGILVFFPFWNVWIHCTPLGSIAYSYVFKCKGFNVYMRRIRAKILRQSGWILLLFSPFYLYGKRSMDICQGLRIEDPAFQRALITGQR